MRHLIRQEDMALMRGGQREPSVAFASRISVDADQMRRRLEAKLNISASKLIERALMALARALNQAGQHAE